MKLLEQELSRHPAYRLHGRVRGCTGSLLTCGGLDGLVSIGDACRVERRGHNRRECEADDGGGPGRDLLAEVVAFREDGALLLPYGEVTGVGFGARVTRDGRLDEVRPTSGWLGRVLDPLARPLDGGPPLPVAGGRAYALHAAAPPACTRRPLGPRLDLGVRALNLFAPCREGQRMGIFAGAGVGKSTLLSMLARFSDADALVIGLIGERGREVNEFLHGTLGAAGLARSVVVVATSDLPALLRRRAALLTLTVAEALRHEGLRVLCLVDSLTRYAMALREIHLAAGEPPTSKGYPPGVFAELPRLLERAGPGVGDGSGSITGLFTVLVEGDDTAGEPVADAVRAILDGHVLLDRAVAEGGRFPAVDVLRSVSRTAPGCYAPEERPLVERARRLLRAHADVAELIQLGAYRAGGDPLVDEAIRLRPALEALLAQDSGERSGVAADFARLAEALGPEGGGG